MTQLGPAYVIAVGDNYQPKCQAKEHGRRAWTADPTDDLEAALATAGIHSETEHPVAISHSLETQ